MPLKVCEIYDFANPFWNDFTRKSVAMSMTWLYWFFGFFGVAKNYDSQMVLRSTMYRKSMVFLFWKQGLYSFGVTLGRKKKIYIKISKFTM